MLEKFLHKERTTVLAISEDVYGGKHTSLSEAILGIIPGSFVNLMNLLLPHCVQDVEELMGDDNIFKKGTFVCGIIPGSPAYSSGRIFLGDYVVSVDGTSVMLDDCEDVMRNVSLKYNGGEIKITVRSLLIDKLSSYFGRTTQTDHVVHFGENVHWTNLCNSLSLFHFAFFCCKHGDSDGIEQKQSYYIHPLSHQRLAKALEGVIPCLLMLSDDYSRRSTINYMQVVLEKEKISVAVHYSSSFGSVVLALPGHAVDSNACFKALKIMIRVILFYFGSLDRAFATSDSVVTDETDRTISVILFEILCSDLLFEELQISTEMSWSLFQTKIIEIPYLPLPETVKVSVDSLLTDFESSDFADPFLIPPRRRFNIIGSCLFYKGFLVASHLNTTDLVDIGLFMRHRLILSALAFSSQTSSTLCGSLLEGPSVPELVALPRGEQSLIWCEVFPTRRSGDDIEAKEESQWPTFGYSEPAGARYVLLVVPKKQTFLAVLLETSGLTTANSTEDLVPDSVIIREASKLLIRLDGIGLLAFCEQGLASSLGVKMISADVAYPTASLFTQSNSRRSGVALQTLAVANAKRFSTALKLLLRAPARSHTPSLSSSKYNWDVDSSGVDEVVTNSQRKSMIASLSEWIARRKERKQKKELKKSESLDNLSAFDALHYFESRKHSLKADVPGSHIGSGTLTSSDSPGRNDGIPLPVSNALTTLFDMSDAHLHSGEISSRVHQSGNQRGVGNAGFPTAVIDIMHTCPGNTFGFIHFDRNQGLYVCPTDTFTPPNASAFHRRVIASFLRSSLDSFDLCKEESALEEVVVLYPTDPLEWFQYDKRKLENTIKHRMTRGHQKRDSGPNCTSASCTMVPVEPIAHREAVTREVMEQSFDLNPVAEAQSFWCTIRKFPRVNRAPSQQESDISSHTSSRMFALCGDELAAASVVDLALQFAFDLAL